MRYTLENENIRAEFDTAGAELRAVTDVKTGYEYMWCGDAAFWGRVSPVLFPVVGQYRDKESIYDGVTYHLGQHGFARDREFQLLKKEDNQIWFRLQADEESKKVYPFSFRLDIGYELKERSIEVIWGVGNEDTREMFYSIGAHPAFACDLSKDALRFDGCDKIVAGYLQNGCLYDRTEEIALKDGVLALTPELFDDDALILEKKQTGEVQLLRADKPVVTVTFDAPLVGIWSPTGKNAPLVCIEPWFGRSDRVDFSKKLEEREHGNHLNVGEERRHAYTMRFEEM